MGAEDASRVASAATPTHSIAGTATGLNAVSESCVFPCPTTRSSSAAGISRTLEHLPQKPSLSRASAGTGPLYRPPRPIPAEVRAWELQRLRDTTPGSATEPAPPATADDEKWLSTADLARRSQIPDPRSQPRHRPVSACHWVCSRTGEAGSELLHADHDLLCPTPWCWEQAQLDGHVGHVEDDPQLGDLSVAVLVNVDAVDFDAPAGGGYARWVERARWVAPAFHQ